MNSADKRLKTLEVEREEKVHSISWEEFLNQVRDPNSDINRKYKERQDLYNGLSDEEKDRYVDVIEDRSRNGKRLSLGDYSLLVSRKEALKKEEVCVTDYTPIPIDTKMIDPVVKVAPDMVTAAPHMETADPDYVKETHPEITPEERIQFLRTMSEKLKGASINEPYIPETPVYAVKYY